MDLRPIAPPNPTPVLDQFLEDARRGRVAHLDRLLEHVRDRLREATAKAVTIKDPRRGAILDALYALTTNTEPLTASAHSAGESQRRKEV